MTRVPSWLRLVFSVGVFALVLRAVDPGAAWERLHAARLAPVLGAMVMAHVVILVSAIRWADTADRLGHPVPLQEAVREYYASTLLNQVLPGGVGGDAARVWRARRRGGLGPVARGVAIERLSGQIAIASALTIGVGLGGVPGTGRLVAAFIAGVAVVLISLTFLRGFVPDLGRAWGTPRAAFAQGCLNVLITGALVGGFWLCARAVGTPMGAEALVIVPICLAAMLVPAGVGGLGLREGAAALLWPLAGYPAEAGVAAALLFGLAALLAALPGIGTLAGHRP